MLIFDIRPLWHSALIARVPECQKFENGEFDQYGAEPFEQQQFGTAGIERVKLNDNTALLKTLQTPGSFVAPKS